LPDVRDYMQFRQDKLFWYLTGVESQRGARHGLRERREVLLLPEATTVESWDGAVGHGRRMGPRADGHRRREVEREARRSVARLHQERLEDLDLDAPQRRARRMLRPGVRHRCGDPRRPFDGRASRRAGASAALERTFHTKPSDFSQQIGELRRVKPEEIAAMRRAGRAGALAMAEAIRSASAGLGEWGSTD
jgi:Xaa-Pro aminopeptidase